MTRDQSMKAALLAVSMSVIACGGGASRDTRPSKAIAAPARTTVTTAGGEVVADSATAPAAAKTEHWITDANTLSLASALNARAIAAADLELENWHVDTARAFAASMAREHADLQHSIDSLTARLNMTPVSPALAKTWTSTMQAQIDSVRRAGDAGIDLAFVRQQANAHQLMSDYLSQLASVAERPELRGFFESMAAKTASQAARAQALLPTVARIDSTRRDATRKRGATQ